MPSIVIAAAILLGIYLLARWFARADVGSLLRPIRSHGMLLGVLVVAALAMTGRIGLAVAGALVILALQKRGLLTRPQPAASPFPPGLRPKSLVRSAALEVEVDHENGRMTGRVLAGSFEGQDLDALDPAALTRLAREIGGDPESRALLEVYLDRRLPGWRLHMKQESAAGRRGPTNSGAMSEEEAYQILGLEKGAGEGEIRAAHRRLMKRVHPDQGGSTFLAVRINQAKDRLLSKHR